jgi:hypothetical protein
MRRAPPERFHVFVSYTTREDEVRVVKPIVDRFLEEVLRPIIERELGEPAVFYDGYALRAKRFPDAVVETVIRYAVDESELLLSFVSPEYLTSRWCLFECRSMATKRPRAWFDICRKAPIEELRDRRPPGVRPGRWECLYAAWRRFRWRAGGGVAPPPPPPAERIVPIVWKGGTDAVDAVPELAGGRVFQWTGCIRAAEAYERVLRHLARHGSVSPSWEFEAEERRRECEREMTRTALVVASMLRRCRPAPG